MNKLTLNEQLQNKLDRLDKKVKPLVYLGIDPNSLTDRPMVAVIGTRKPTPYGKQITEQIVSELVATGVVIVSGLAFGIDVLAHKTALSHGGVNISILPSGIKNIYPASNRRIGEEITIKGCLISEYSAHHQPRKSEFLERNRIIAALSDAILIPEAAERSGSLNTASHAAKMNIPVCAVPGPITSEMSCGTNKLIKDGATLTRTAQDILKLLNLSQDTGKIIAERSPIEQEILEQIKSGIDDSLMIQKNLDLSVSKIQGIMTDLEIDGIIEQNELGKWMVK